MKGKMKSKHVADMVGGKMHDHLGKHKDGMKQGHSKLEKLDPAKLGGPNYTGEPEKGAEGRAKAKKNVRDMGGGDYD